MRSEKSRARQNAYYKIWYQENKEKRMESAMKRAQANKDKMAWYRKKHYEANKEKINARNMKWSKDNHYYEKNREKIIARNKAYYYRKKYLALTSENV